MDRRGFLGSILAGCATPAIVRAESLMKLWVPPQQILTLDEFVANTLDPVFDAMHKNSVKISFFLGAGSLQIGTMFLTDKQEKFLVIESAANNSLKAIKL